MRAMLALLVVLASSAFAETGESGDTAETGTIDAADSGTVDTAPSDTSTSDCDDVDLVIPVEVAIFEGSTLSLGRSNWCRGSTTLAWESLETDFLSCQADGEQVHCVARDDGRAALAASVYSIDGELLRSSTIPVNVLNVPPAWSPDSHAGKLSSKTATLTVGEFVYLNLVAADPGADAVTITVKNGPPGLELSASGEASWTVAEADVGDWVPVFTFTDDDGERTAYFRSISVVEADTDSLCSSCAVVTMGVATGIAHGLRRRKHAWQ